MDENQMLNLKRNLNLSKISKDATMRLSKKSLEHRYENTVFDLIKGFQQVASFVDLKNSIQQDSVYKVVIPKDISEKLKDGILKHSIDQQGKLLPTIRNQKGEITYQLRLEEMSEEFISNANNLVIQASMAIIIEKLEEITHKVDSILSGQFSDRMGIIRGAIEVYKQSLVTQNVDTKLNLLNQLVVELNIGRAQLIESLKDLMQIVDVLPSNSFQQILYPLINKVNVLKIEKSYLKIQEVFEGIIMASMYIGLAYEELKESVAMKDSFIPLQECLELYAGKNQKIIDFLPYDSKNQNKIEILTDVNLVMKSIQNHLNSEKKNIDYIELELTGHQLITLERERLHD